MQECREVAGEMAATVSRAKLTVAGGWPSLDGAEPSDRDLDNQRVPEMRTLGRALVLLFSIGLAGLNPAARGFAQVSTELTVEESVRLGLEHNARLRAARTDADAARAAHREVRASRMPAVRTQAGYTRLGGEIPEGDFILPGLDTAIALLPIEMNRYHAELSLEQPLFTGFRLQNRVRAAGHEADAARLVADQEAVDVGYEIRRAYWGLTAAIAVREAVDGALEQVDEHLRNVQTRVAAGTALTSEQLAAQTRRSEVLLDRIEAENAVRIGRLELSRGIGLPLDTPIQPVETPEVEPLPADLDVLVARSLEARPQLAAQLEQLRALRAQLDVARGTRLPELAFVGRYVYARPSPYAITDQDQFRGTWEAGLALQWSLWEGGQRQARTSQARAHVQSAEARLAYTREEAVVQVTRQYLEARRATEAVEVAAQNVAEAEETFRVVRQQFAEGVALSAQVLDAEQTLRMARSRRARALADYEIARAALLHATGQVW